MFLWLLDSSLAAKVRRNDSLARFVNQRPQQDELVQRHIIPVESDAERLEHRQQIGATLNRQYAFDVLRLMQSEFLGSTRVLYGAIHKGRPQKYSKNRPTSLVRCCPNWAISPLPSCGCPQRWLNMQWADLWTSSNYQMSVSDYCWHWQDIVLAVGCQRVISIYLLPIPRTPQSTRCELWFIQLVTLSVFLSLSTVHCYKFRTSAPAKASLLVHIGPHHFYPYSLPLHADVLLWMIRITIWRRWSLNIAVDACRHLSSRPTAEELEQRHILLSMWQFVRVVKVFKICSLVFNWCFQH